MKQIFDVKTSSTTPQLAKKLQKEIWQGDLKNSVFQIPFGVTHRGEQHLLSRPKPRPLRQVGLEGPAPWQSAEQSERGSV